MRADTIRDIAAAARLACEGVTGPFWITRDSDSCGVLDDHVTVWTERPRRVTLLAGAFWFTDIPPRSKDMAGHVAHLPIETVARWLSATGTCMPENDRECVRVG